jgi:hypothetical protein
MGMFEQFETDENLEKDGVWLDYGDFRVKVAHTGGANKAYTKMLEEKTRPYRRAIKNSSFSEERSVHILSEIFAKTIVLDWEVIQEQEDGEYEFIRGIHSKDGSILEFNEQNVLLSFKLLPKLLKDIQEQASLISLFRREELEDDSKN